MRWMTNGLLKTLFARAHLYASYKIKIIYFDFDSSDASGGNACGYACGHSPI
jgi:hypothetical protein